MSNAYSKCRYGDTAAKIVGDRPVVLDRSENDYQGTVYVEAGDERGYVVIEYSYGSCSDCDDWEARDLDPDQILEEMERCTMRFTPKAYENWKKLLLTPGGSSHE